VVEITLAVAVLAGLASFVAPCILPMIPAFLAYISGTTLSELNQKNGSNTVTINRTNIILNSVFFVIGFSFVFLCLIQTFSGNAQSKMKEVQMCR